MNETQQLQFQLDLRTGFQTAIHGNASSENIRSACSAINARRTRGIMEAAKHSPSSQSVQADVWAAAFTQQAQHWEVPLIDLSRLGISHNQAEQFRLTNIKPTDDPFSDIPDDEL